MLYFSMVTALYCHTRPVRWQVRWQIGRITKGRLPCLHGIMVLDRSRLARQLSLSLFVVFRIMYSASGLKVDSLRVDNEDIQPYKGVRSIVRAGLFEVRI